MTKIIKLDLATAMSSLSGALEVQVDSDVAISEKGAEAVKAAASASAKKGMDKIVDEATNGYVSAVKASFSEKDSDAA